MHETKIFADQFQNAQNYAKTSDEVNWGDKSYPIFQLLSFLVNPLLQNLTANVWDIAPNLSAVFTYPVWQKHEILWNKNTLSTGSTRLVMSKTTAIPTINE